MTDHQDNEEMGRAAIRRRLAELHSSFSDHLQHGIIPFWLERAWDETCKGFLTGFDEQGRDRGTPEKILYSQCRQLWFFCHVLRFYPQIDGVAVLARGGVDYLREHFWDRVHSGWYWKVSRNGSLLDDTKVVYGQSFAIYALAEYALATGDRQALELAARTFDLLRQHAADRRHGGYFEFLAADWKSLSDWQDRKSLDGQMHLMEALTVLAEVSNAEAHRKDLAELAEVIATKMIEPKSGCGLNQFDDEFRPVPAITIPKMWNDKERKAAQPSPADATSYGHNAELAWLFCRVTEVAEAEVRLRAHRLEAQYLRADSDAPPGRRPLPHYAPIIRRLLDHTLAAGVDWECGGVYRYGRAHGEALDKNKDFWPQAEALIGFLDGFELFADTRYLDAVENIWEFVRSHMIVPGVGEWRSLLDRHGAPLDPNTGQPWKDAYHTGRAMIECTRRLQRLLAASW